MKNLEYEKNFYLDLLNNLTGLEYKIYGYDLYLNGKMINSFNELGNLVKFLNFKYNDELLKLTRASFK